MKLTDSRRLTGPNLLLDGAGAVVEIDLEGDRPARWIEAWREHARAVLQAVGWGGATLATRAHQGGLALALSAPIDALYAATEVNEWALAATEAELAGADRSSFDEGGLETAESRLRAEIQTESNPSLIALSREATDRGIAFLSDDDEVSIGLGTGSRRWPAREVPPGERVDWEHVHEIPVALVTGTNGKSTTVRLLSSIASAAAKNAGSCSTDGIRVGDTVIEEGDYSGPGGARQVLRHPTVELALLETARGGILRRGLVLNRADVALVTNIAEDHLGESGIYDLDDMAQAKLIVAKAAERLVLNADDPVLVRHSADLDGPITWFSLDSENRILETQRQRGRTSWRLMDRHMVADRGSSTTRILTVDEIPATLGGFARHNVANALAAAAVAAELGLSLDAIREGLSSFESSPSDNPGRLNVFELGGVRAIVDFAHNPHGMEALLDMAASLPATRRLVTTGQAGDRDDASIQGLAARVGKARPDRVLVKRLDAYRRGRAPGEVQDLLFRHLQQQGLSESDIGRAETDLDSVRQALAWARDGDLLLLVTHSERSEVLALLERLQHQGWRPGEPLP